MNVQKILVPVDFTETTEKAIELAVHVAGKSNMAVSLIHVATGKSKLDCEEKLKELSAQYHAKSGVTIDCILNQGNIISELTKASGSGEFGLMVIGSHGFKGIREKVFGADILKLLKNIPIPALTIQNGFQIKKNLFDSILFPSSSHDSLVHKINATIFIAKLFDSEVHIYSVEKPGVAWSEKLVNNINKARQAFDQNHIPFINVKEPQSAFSVGYAKQIMDYAKRTRTNLIALMSNPTVEHYYIADADKEIILTNDASIPVLSTNEKSVI
ncbi:MAG: universal stress protein [Bacteroidales bacterium]|nr:universal stress protein [Bacteroidales bacterium]